MGRRWTETEIALLIEHYPEKGGRFVAELLARSVQSVSKQACNYGLVSPFIGGGKRWSVKEIALLKKHYPTKGSKYVAKLVGRSPKRVREKARSYGVTTSFTGV